MNLSELEQHIFAYFMANRAQDLNMVPRYWPYGELVLIVEDKLQMATRKFGVKAEMACPKVARALLDLMLEREAFSTVKNNLGAMHQFQSKNYQDWVAELQKTNPIIVKAQAAGPTFWEDSFAALR